MKPSRRERKRRRLAIRNWWRSHPRYYTAYLAWRRLRLEEQAREFLVKVHGIVEKWAPSMYSMADVTHIPLAPDGTTGRSMRIPLSDACEHVLRPVGDATVVAFGTPPVGVRQAAEVCVKCGFETTRLYTEFEWRERLCQSTS